MLTKILQILGFMFISWFILIFTISAFLNWNYWIENIRDFFYGLKTWQKKVPVYRDIGNNQFSNLFAFMFPIERYEWKKRETPKIITQIKKWYNGKIKCKNNKRI